VYATTLKSISLVLYTVDCNDKGIYMWLTCCIRYFPCNAAPMHWTSEVSNFPLAVEAVGNMAFIVLWIRGTAHKPLRRIRISRGRDEGRRDRGREEGGMEEEEKEVGEEKGWESGRKVRKISLQYTLQMR
jgi:hypothetical protein